MNRIPTIAAAAAVALSFGAAAVVVSQQKGPGVAPESAAAGQRELPAVEVALAENRTLSRTVRLAGTLKSGSRATLSPKIGGKVEAVLVRVGDSVRRGQVLARIDLADTRRQVEQARAAAAAARAGWEKAAEGERLKQADVRRRIAQAERGLEQARLQVKKAEAGIRLQGRASQADVERAQAGVDAARSALAKAKAGARPEQRRQAEIQVRQAERGVALAKKSLDDVEFLYGKGGTPRVQLDEAREGYQKALDGLAQAKAQAELVEAGATPEEISAAEAQVRSAEAALAAARAAAGREEVNEADRAAALGQVREAEAGLESAKEARRELQLARADVRAARAGYEQASAGVRLAEQQLAAGEITSPVDGVVTAVNTNPGELAGPGQPAVVITGTSGVYLEALVPARVIQDLRLSQPVAVMVEGIPGRTFPGTIRSIGAVAGPDGRSFPVEVDLSAPGGLLKPGSFARAEVTVRPKGAAVTVPAAAVRAEGDRTLVWIVRDGRLAEVTVRVPTQDERYALVEGDVRAGEQVVLSGASGLRPGDEVDARLSVGQ